MTREMMQLKIEKSIARARREGFFATADALRSILDELTHPRPLTLQNNPQLPNEEQLN